MYIFFFLNENIYVYNMRKKNDDIKIEIKQQSSLIFCYQDEKDNKLEAL